MKDDSELKTFAALLDEYDESFATSDIALFRSLHVTDDALVFYDNHAGCDSNRYIDHKAKVLTFLQSGKVDSIARENARVFRADRVACITATLRYAAAPTPGVRTTYILGLEKDCWEGSAYASLVRSKRMCNSYIITTPYAPIKYLNGIDSAGLKCGAARHTARR